MPVYTDEIHYEGKHDLDETVCTIRWCVQDVLDMMAHEGFELTDENLDAILNNRLGKHLKDRSIEEGWEILDTLICDAMWYKKHGYI